MVLHAVHRREPGPWPDGGLCGNRVLLGLSAVWPDAAGGGIPKVEVDRIQFRPGPGADHRLAPAVHQASPSHRAREAAKYAGEAKFSHSSHGGLLEPVATGEAQAVYGHQSTVAREEPRSAVADNGQRSGVSAVDLGEPVDHLSQSGLYRKEAAGLSINCGQLKRLKLSRGGRGWL